MKRKKIIALLAAATLTASLTVTGCGTAAAQSASSVSTQSQDSGTPGEDSASDGSEETGSAAKTLLASTEVSTENGDLITLVTDLDLDNMFTERDLSGEYDAETASVITLNQSSASVQGSGVTVDGSIITITEAGTYIVSGTLSDGEIIVDAGDDAKVQIVLDNAEINHEDGSAILVKSADKVFLTLAADSENTLSDGGGEYTQDEEVDSTIDGVIYSTSTLTLNGSGSLTVKAEYSNAIVCKDDLKITGGSYELTAANKGIDANDSIRITNAVINITAGDDGIHSDTEDKEGKGYIYIESGTLTIAAGDDGIHAATALLILDGTIDVTESCEGLEGDTIDIQGGEITVVASDDGLNASTGSGSSDGFGDSAGGGAGDFAGNGMNGTPPQRPDGQDFNPAELPQTSETASATAAAGEQSAPAGDTAGGGTEKGVNETDGTTTAGGRQGGMPDGGQGGFGGGMAEGNTDAYIRITGGTIEVTADGDGIDSNGSFVLEGGEVYVSGPTNDGNGALDVGSTATVSGGTLVAAGSSGMAVGFSGDSGQYSILCYFDGTAEGGTQIVLTDSDGNEVLAYTPSREYSSVVITTEDLTAGEYTITAGEYSETVTIGTDGDSGTAFTIGTQTGGRAGMGMGAQRNGGRGGMQQQGGETGGPGAGSSDDAQASGAESAETS